MIPVRNRRDARWLKHTVHRAPRFPGPRHGGVDPCRHQHLPRRRSALLGRCDRLLSWSNAAHCLRRPHPGAETLKSSMLTYGRPGEVAFNLLFFQRSSAISASSRLICGDFSTWCQAVDHHSAPSYGPGSAASSPTNAQLRRELLHRGSHCRAVGKDRRDPPRTLTKHRRTDLPEIDPVQVSCRPECRQATSPSSRESSPSTSNDAPSSPADTRW